MSVTGDGGDNSAGPPGNREALRLAQALCTRLCHDLAGPLGAIGSGLELLGDGDAAGGGDAEVVGLLSDSAASAATRLRFLRALLGLPGGRGLDPGDAHSLLNAHLAGGAGARVPALDWDVAHGDGSTAARARVQFLLNLCLVALEALPRHERLSVRAPGQTDAEVSVGGRGQVARAPLEAMAAGQAGAPVPDDARLVQAHYAGRLAAALGLAVRAEPESGHLRLVARPSHA